MSNLFDNLTQYIEQQEQRIAALEARLLAAEQQAATANTSLLALTQRFNSLQAKLDELDQRSIDIVAPQPSAEEEPEVEIELIVDDSDDKNEEQEAPVEKEKQEEEHVQVEEQQTQEIKEEAKSELHRPQQTSLFGTSVSDIRQAISIGDRFLFQRELFDGNGEQMQKMLDRLNTCSGMTEAMQLVADKDWDKESSTYELFINVLRRRFN